MSVKVRIPSPLRNYTNGADVVEAQGGSVGEVLNDLKSRAAGIEQRLFKGANQLNRFVNVYVNDEDIRFLKNLETPVRHIPMTNAERSSTFYRFDSMEQLRVWREMDERDEEPVVIYHSHTATEAYPSRTDLNLAAEPGAHYLLVSTRDPEVTEIRSFRIVDGSVTEEPVRVDGLAVQSYKFGHTPTMVEYECRA